jgi:hypothetical protein
MNRLVAFLAVALLPCQLFGQAAPAKKAGQTGSMAKAAPAARTAEWKIQNAMTAGPASVTKNATVMDWPSSPTDSMKQLRAGTNGWTCMPDIPDTPGNDPMCLDKTWMKWAGAWMSHQPVQINEVGLAYMLQGGSDASNTDPFKMKPDAGQKWVNSGAHVMVLTPNLETLAALPTEYSAGGPWVMWKGTPYAHIMVPVK